MNSQKLNFIDELENLRNENIALKRAVESKSAAIGILRNELQECQKERDEFRNVAENHPVISQPLPNLKTIPTCPERTSAILGGSENTLAQLLSQSKEENKALRLEISDLKCRLYDAQSDLKILRGEKSRKADSQQCRLSIASTSQLAQQERESLIQQLEELSSKCQIQETDLRCLLEEREELVKERDEIRHKWHRLNHVLNKILVPSFSLTENSDKVKLRKNRRIVDLDAIIAENRYLQQRLKQVLEEKALVVSNASKYKTALERGRVRPNSNSSNKLGFTDTLIMSPKQVAEFLKEHNIDSQMGEGGNPSSKDMKLLCVALLDSLNQKSRFIKTQKAANKMLIERVTNLERQVLIQSDDENHKITPATSTMIPTEINLISASLMEGYNPSITTNDVNSENVDQMLNAIQREIDDGEEGNTNSEEDEIERNGKCIDNVDFNKDIDIIDNESNIDDKSDSEEIVPLENLDKYISNLKEKRRKDLLKVSQKNKNNDSNSEDSDDLVEDNLGEEKEEIKSTERNISGNLDGVQNNCKISNLNVENKENISSIKLGKNSLSSDGDEKLHKQSHQNRISKHKNRSKSPMSSSSSSFDIDISDYESDDDTFEQTLCNWQAECDKASANRQTLIAKLSPKKSKSSMARILKSRKVDLPDKLKGILN